MKNRTYILLMILASFLSLSSCNYLDVVPDERPTEEDAFKDKKATERYLYSCYGFMMKERAGVTLYQHGEVVTDFEKSFLQGNYSAANIGEFHYWSRMYGGIKRCYQLLANIDNVPRMEESEKTIYKAEAKFLIAYFHFVLLRAYGPVVIADKEYSTDIEVANFPKRAKFDDCVIWISKLLDEAFNTGLVDQHTAAYYGRATKIAAKALKSRLLLYVASPLFNGNSKFYSNQLLDPETQEPLMNQTYSEQKWTDALAAAQEAITLAENANYRLYKNGATENKPYPKDSTEYSLRMTFVDRDNLEVIWADTRKETNYDLQNQCTPRDPNNDGASWNGVAPTLETVMNFYTENGLPIAEDPAYFSEDQYFNLGQYEGEKTCNLHLKREPRFYAWISFHNGWYEMQRDGEQRIRTLYRNQDVHGKGTMTRNFSLSGYLLKKGVSPSYDTQNGYPNYPWPLIRLAELYLNCAEAAVECNKLDIARTYLNKVRDRAGIPSVEESWNGVAALDQTNMRKIVRQERTIELFLEGHYGWDVRRWMEAENALNHNPYGLNTNGVADVEFFQKVQIDMRRKFTSPINYLLPINNKEINVNSRLVQNPGY